MVRYCEGYWKDVDKVLERVPRIDDINGKSILITGSTGMICSSVVDLLLRYNKCFGAGIQIKLGGRSLERVCARFNSFEEGKDFFFVPYDATVTWNTGISGTVSGDENPMLIQNTDGPGPFKSLCSDYIIHGASNADPAALVAEPVETMLANITGLNSLLALACKEQDVSSCDGDNNIHEGSNSLRRLLYISSSEVYGSRIENSKGNLSSSRECRQVGLEQSFREEEYGFVDILNSRAAYPSSKRAAETLCVAYGNEYSLNTVIVRPGHIYGPSITDTDSRASSQFIRNVAKGENIVLKSAGTQLRSYCYTLDCASAILTVLHNGEVGNAYNISNRESVVTIRDIAYALAKVAGTQVVYEEPSAEEKKSYNMMDNSSLNATKLEQLGWSAIFGLEEGVKKSVEFYRSGT